MALVAYSFTFCLVAGGRPEGTVSTACQPGPFRGSLSLPSVAEQLREMERNPQIAGVETPPAVHPAWAVQKTNSVFVQEHHGKPTWFHRWFSWDAGRL